MLRRITGVLAGAAFLTVIPTVWQMMHPDALSPAIGLPIIIVAFLIGVPSAAYSLFADHIATRFSFPPRQEQWSLSEACHYVAERSVWARVCPDDMEKWNRALPQIICDAAGEGRVAATGRRGRTENHAPDRAENRSPIPPDFWPSAWFQAIPNVFKPSSDTRDIVYDQRGGVKVTWYDVKLSALDVRREWRPLPFWSNFKGPVQRYREENKIEPN